MSTASEIAGDVTTVVMILMILTLLGLGWAWLALWLVARVIQMRHYIVHGAPNYNYLERMEAALFADNLTQALERERERNKA